MNFKKSVSLTAVVLFAGSAAVAAKTSKVQEVLSKYEKTGESVNCLRARSLSETDVLDDYTILVEAPGGVYLNELNGRCSGLAREERYVRDSPDARLCKGDIIRVIDTFGNMMGSCSLGAFEKLSEIEQADTQSE